MCPASKRHELVQLSTFLYDTADTFCFTLRQLVVIQFFGTAAASRMAHGPAATEAQSRGELRCCGNNPALPDTTRDGSDTHVEGEARGQ
jgi:hypothetical protein